MTPSTARARLPRARSLLAAPVSTALVLGALATAPLAGPLAAPALAAATCTDGAVVGKEPISLGVGCLGNLDPAALGTGLAFGYAGDTPRDGLAGATGDGGPSEGWGVVHAASGTGGTVAGGSSDGLTLVDFTVGQGTDGSDQTVTSVVDVGGVLEVTHFYRPTSQEGVYAVDVEIENTSDVGTDISYRRVADLDVDPTGGNEVVTLQTGSTTKLAHLGDDGSADPSPTVAPDPTSTGADVLDAGPGDLGVVADLELGGLPVGGSKVFTLYYGASGSESTALEALYALDAEAYALGQNSDPEGPSEGTPATYLLGFSGLGGTPMRAPTAAEDHYTVPPDETTTLLVTLNDSPDGSVPTTGLEIAWVEPGWNGTVTCGTASCEYTPSPGSISDYFRYLLSDGHGGFDMGEVLITVEEPVTPDPAATNDARPTITGSGVQGEVLTGQDGSWTSTGAADGSDLTFTRQWLVDGTPVDGETGHSFVPGPEHVGQEVTFEVTASRADAEDVPATSDPVTVTDTPDAATNDSPPSIVGSGYVGDLLAGDRGAWTSTGAADGSDLTFAYRWLLDGVAIPDEDGLSYTPVAGDVGKEVTFEVTVSRTGGQDVKMASGPVTVSEEPPPPPPAAATNTTRPSISAVTTISGAVTYEEVLTGHDGAWTSTGAPDGSDLSFARRWLADGVEVGTGASYQPTADDVGSEVVFEVTASRAGATPVSAQSDPITISPAAAPEPVGTREVRLSTEPRARGVISVDPGTWTPTPDHFTYEWEFRAHDGGPYVPFSTSRSATVPAAAYYLSDAGQVRVTVSAHLAGHATGTWVTGREAREADDPTTRVMSPEISGDVRVGGTVTASTGQWTEHEGWDFHYQWFVNGRPVGQPLSTEPTLFLDPAMIVDYEFNDPEGRQDRPIQDGDELRVAVQPRKLGYGWLAPSFSGRHLLGTAAITITAPPSIAGTPRVGETLTLVPATYELADGVDAQVIPSTTWYARWRGTQIRRELQYEGRTLVVPDWAAGYLIEVEQLLTVGLYPWVITRSDPVGPVGALPYLRAGSVPRETARVGQELDVSGVPWLEYGVGPVSGVTATVEWRVDGTAVATGPTYTPEPHDVGSRLTADVVGEKPGYTQGRTIIRFGTIRPAEEAEATLDVEVVRADDPAVRVPARIVLCGQLDCDGAHTGDGTARLTVPATPDGTDFDLEVYPVADLVDHHSRVRLVAGERLEVRIEVRAPTPTGPDADLSDTDSTTVDTDGDGVPDTELDTVRQHDPQTLTVRGCPGQTGRVWQVVFADGSPTLEGSLTEVETGVYRGEIPGFTSTGWADVVTTVARGCSEDDTVDFTLYIDPSGIVTDQFGRPVPGATVTLLRAGDDGNGVTAFLPVEDGDTAVMDPSVNTANPSFTTATGFFRWDVTPGDYQVRVHAAESGGAQCEVTTTPAMEVPPERVDLVIRTDCEGAERPEPTTAPELTGTLAVGETLSVTEGEWPEPFVPMRTVWLRNGEAVATGSTYEVTEADLGAEVVARVQAIRPDYVQENGTGEVVRFDPTWADVAAGALTSPSSLTVKVTPKKLRERAKPKVTVKVRTEGAAAPTGAVKVLLKPKGSTKGKRVKKTVVLAEGDRPVVRVRLPKVRKGKYLLLVRYAGDDLVEKARTVRKTLRVKAR